MRLSIEEDVSAEPGHARLRLEGVAPAADMRFRLSRKAQDPPNLGRDGWQAEPALLEPLEVRAEGGDTVLLVAFRADRVLLTVGREGFARVWRAAR